MKAAGDGVGDGGAVAEGEDDGLATVGVPKDPAGTQADAARATARTARTTQTRRAGALKPDPAPSPTDRPRDP